jgi:hypothetical protein
LKDWRLNGQERFLQGVVLFFGVYRPYKPEWDHDHCEFCSAKFSLSEAGALKEGFSTADGYRWICQSCFADFNEQFQWRL